MTESGPKCLVCGADLGPPVGDPTGLPGVTSDAKPQARACPIHCCPNCGHVQKGIDADWRRQVDEIYADYAIYRLSGGAEQPVFGGSMPVARSAEIVKRLGQGLNLPLSGRLLDIGCGNGGFLKAFNRHFPEWELFGLEINDRHRAEVERIPGVAGFYCGSVDSVPGRFDLISLIHVLEHLTEPVEVLRRIRDRLTTNGLILVQTPDFRRNPFDLMVVDHASHYLKQTIRNIFQLANIKTISLTGKWVAKELSLVGGLIAEGEGGSPEPPADSRAELERALDWLGRVAEHAAGLALNGGLGVFGTATAGTWLAGVLGEDRVSFFVDEDPNKRGATHLGRPVIAPADVPAGSSVYLAFEPAAAAAIGRRFKRTHPRLKLAPPPPYGGAPQTWPASGQPWHELCKIT